jgi:methyl-accepting chemotaxis protein
MGLFDGLGKALGADGLGKVTDLVNDLWDKREDIVHAIGWVKDHGDDLVRFMQHLPETLGKVGDSMDTAGKAAHTASGFLGSVGGGGDGTTVADLAQAAGEALVRAQGQIGSVANVLGNIGGHFEGVPLLGSAAKEMTHGAGFLSSFTDEMSDIAAKLASLAERVGVVSGHLADVGSGLSDSSSTLKSFTS